MSYSIDEDIPSQTEFVVHLPYDEYTEKHVAWSKYRMEIIREFGIKEDRLEIVDDQ